MPPARTPERPSRYPRYLVGMPSTPLPDRIQRRFPVIGFPLAVVYKFFDDMGSYLSALLTYYLFVSLFPCLLLASTALSIVLRNHPDVQQRLLHSAMAEFPVVGSQLAAPSALSGGGVGVVVSIVATLYGAIGAAQAFQYAANTVWQVPRNSRPNPFKARGRSILLLLTIGLGLVLTSSFTSIVSPFIHLGPFTGRLVEVGVVLIDVGVVALGFRLATTADTGWLDVLPGAVLTAVCWQVLQTFGVRYVQHVIARASATNGVFATVLGLLAFLYLLANIVVVSMELNAVRARHLWPRALLTPFTDNVELTHGDERAYAGQARATRSKGFQTIDVSFDSTHQDDEPGATEAEHAADEQHTPAARAKDASSTKADTQQLDAGH